jgi:hypothetical protein
VPERPGQCVNVEGRHFEHLKYQINVSVVSLPVVLYGCKTRSLILREEHRLRVFENMVLRWIFEPKRYEVTG